MTKAYFTEDAKLTHSPYPSWSMKACTQIHNLLGEKGYPANIVSRLGCDREWHDAWEVERNDVPYIIEQLFRQRITVEVQAEGHGKASIIFVYDYAESTIIHAVSKFQKNRRGK